MKLNLRLTSLLLALVITLGILVSCTPANTGDDTLDPVQGSSGPESTQPTEPVNPNFDLIVDGKTTVKIIRPQDLTSEHISVSSAIKIRDEIDKLTDGLGLAIQNLVLNDDLPNDSSTWESKIEMLRVSNRLYFMIYGDDLMFYHNRISFNHWLISTYQIALGKTEEAMESLEKMCDHAVSYDISYQNDHGKHYTSFFMDTQVYHEKSKDFHELTEHTHCYYILDRLQSARYDCIREDPRFISIVERLQQYSK